MTTKNWHSSGKPSHAITHEIKTVELWMQKPLCDPHTQWTGEHWMRTCYIHDAGMYRTVQCDMAEPGIAAVREMFNAIERMGWQQ